MAHMHRIKGRENQAMWMDPDMRKALNAKWAEESNKKIATQNKKKKIVPSRPVGHSTLAGPFHSL